MSPKLNTLQQVASVLGCSVRYLICGMELDERFEHYKAIGRVIAVLNSKDSEASRAFWSGLSAAEVIMSRGTLFINYANAEGRATSSGVGRSGSSKCAPERTT
jgi:hypothetical protein